MKEPTFDGGDGLTGSKYRTILCFGKRKKISRESAGEPIRSVSLFWLTQTGLPVTSGPIFFIAYID